MQVKKGGGEKEKSPEADGGGGRPYGPPPAFPGHTNEPTVLTIKRRGLIRIEGGVTMGENRGKKKSRAEGK